MLVDIFIFGSALKGKDKPKDIDIVAVFREKNYEKIEDIIYEIRKKGENLHVEPIVVDNLHKEKVYSFIIHEGFSVRNGKFMSEMFGFKSYIILEYFLENKKKSEKVMFSYALYGRRDMKGLLKSIGGKEIGRGGIMVPVENRNEIINFLDEWKVKYKEQRGLIFE